jgi:hypothetical protein
MATARFRRINIDGKSITETRLATAAILPGTFATISNSTDKFVQATAPAGRLYLIEVGNHQGLSIDEAIPAGSSAVGDYVEEGREFAVRFAASTALKKDDPITVTAGGLGLKGVEGTDKIIGYSQETITLAAGATGLARIRAKNIAIS